MARADLHAFYDRLSAVLDYVANDLGFGFADILSVPDHLLEAPSLTSPRGLTVPADAMGRRC